MPFADACRQVWARKAGASRPFAVGAVNGVDVLAAHDLFSGRLIVTLAVPSNVRQIGPATLFGENTTAEETTDSPAARARGIVQRAENLYKELPGFRAGLHDRKDLADTDLRDLEGLGEVPFEHAAELEARRLELEELTHELSQAQRSDAAVAKAAATADRLAAAGRERGWSLWLNPTPALAESVGVASVAELRQIVLATQAQSAAEYARRRYTAGDGDQHGDQHGDQRGGADAGRGEPSTVQIARRAVSADPTAAPPTTQTGPTPPQATPSRPPTARPQTLKR